SLKNKYTILNKLPTDSYPINYDIKRDKPVDGEEYCIPFNTDITIWIKEFGTSTGTIYNKRKTEHIEKNNTTRIIYQCHHAANFEKRPQANFEERSQANFEERPQSSINDQLQISIENQLQFNAAEQSQPNTTELPQQAQLTTEELIFNIQSLTRALDDLDINRLQVVHDQLSRVISDVRRQERNFQNGDWVGENQRVKFPPNMGFNKQRR
ncbi:230_t:CDS:2, partial [Racocetra fulgida]